MLLLKVNTEWFHKADADITAAGAWYQIHGAMPNSLAQLAQNPPGQNTPGVAILFLPAGQSQTFRHGGGQGVGARGPIVTPGTPRSLRTDVMCAAGACWQASNPCGDVALDACRMQLSRGNVLANVS